MAKTKSQNTVNTSKVNENILKVCLLIMIILLTTFKLSGDDDFFWHLKTGKHILETKSVPSADIFGFATSGHQWIPFEWGWDVLTYSIYSVGGINLLSIFRTMIFISVYFFIYKILRRFNTGISVIAFVIVLMSLGIIDRLLIKPQIISYFFFSLLIYFIVDFRTGSKINFRKLYFVPVIFLIWANMHMGALAGLCIWFIFYFTEIRDKSIRTKLTLITALSAIAFIINPHGFTTYIYAFSHMQMKMLDDVYEWYSPFNKVFIGSRNFIVYIIYLLLTLFTIRYANKKKDYFILILVLFFALLSMRTARYTIDFMVIVTSFIGVALSTSIENSSLKKILRNRVTTLALTAVVLLISLGAVTNEFYNLTNNPQITGFGINENEFPVKAFEFIKQNKISDIGERPFNSFNCGGYLIWELDGKRNFIDSRNLYDDIYFSYKTIYYKNSGFERKLKEFNFDYVVFVYPYLTQNVQELQLSIISYLSNKKDEWKLVYWDDMSFVFVKNEEKFKEVIEKFEYRFINPFYYVHQKEPLQNALKNNHDEVFAEIKRKFHEEPKGLFINSFVKTFKVPVN